MVSRSSPLISVIIPTYNYGNFVCDAVSSALAQSYEPVEVIVVDDGSQDDTPQSLSRYGSKIRYIRQENRGLSAARNRGIHEAKGEYIALLDADDVWETEKLRRQMELLINSQAGMAYSLVSYIDARGLSLEVEHGRWAISREPRKDLLFKNTIAPSTALIKRECFNKVGFFDETLKSSEDWDMWLRIAAHFQIVCLAEPLVRYRLHNSNMSKNVDGMIEQSIRVLERYRDPGMSRLKSAVLRRKAMSFLLFNIASELVSAKDASHRRRLLVKSIFSYPFDYYCRYSSLLQSVLNLRA